MGNKDKIIFDLGQGNQVIKLTKALPEIDNPVTINGLSPVFKSQNVIIDGAALGQTDYGLAINGQGVTVSNLSFVSFSNTAINIMPAGNNATISNNWIGTTQVGGNAAMGNKGDGIDVTTATGVTIQGNTISNNTRVGIQVAGTPATGNAAAPNAALSMPPSDTIANNTISNDGGGGQQTGILLINLMANDAQKRAPGPSNVWITGNTIIKQGQNGISIQAGGGDVVLGNFIGISSANVVDGNGPGGKPAAGIGYGISISYSWWDVIGGLDPRTGKWLGNVVSGNTQGGIYVGSSSNASSTGTVISANYIGTNITGTGITDKNGNDTGNLKNGITLSMGGTITIGGNNYASGNIIADNKGYGIYIMPSAPILVPSQATVTYNRVGTALYTIPFLPPIFPNSLDAINVSFITAQGNVSNNQGYYAVVGATGVNPGQGVQAPMKNNIFTKAGAGAKVGQVGSGPTVNSLSANSGPSAGGNSINVGGTNFTSVVNVSVGNQPAAYTVNSATSITITVPPGPFGSWPVIVTTSTGSSSPASGAMYTYTGPPIAAVSGVSPNSGTTVGFTVVKISGYGFSGASAVYFGAVPAITFVVNADDTITAISPPNAVGTDVVTVVTLGGTTPATAAGQFTYSTATAPAVSSLLTTSGSTAGGTSVVIQGSNFTGLTAVWFGTEAASSFTFLSDGSIVAVAPRTRRGPSMSRLPPPRGHRVLGAVINTPISTQAHPR